MIYDLIMAIQQIYVQLMASISIGAFVVMAWNLRVHAGKSNETWVCIVTPGAISTAAICGLVVAPPEWLSPDAVIESFYVSILMLCGAITWQLQRDKVLRVYVIGSTVLLLFLIVFTGSIVEGAMPHNGLVTRIPGPFYELFLIYIVICLVLQVYGERDILRQMPDPCERNRFRYNIFGLAVTQVVVAALVIAMLFPLPPFSSPMVLPAAGAISAFIYILSTNIRCLPLFALSNDPDRQIHLTCKDILDEYIGLALVLPYSDVIDLLQDDPRMQDMNTPDREWVLKSVGLDSVPVIDSITSLAWNRELEGLAATLASMQPDNVVSQSLIIFKAGEVKRKHYFLYQKK